jgi:p-hydroxybenzoate 3-monooxygenase
VAEFLARGGEIRFDSTVTEVDPAGATVRYRDTAGNSRQLTGRFVAGCDGSQGVARPRVPARNRYRRDHGIAWLAILVEAPQSMAAVTYAVHERGFAGHMARSPSVTRYYLQCAPDDDPGDWTEEQIWEELRTRFRVDEHGALNEGRIIEVTVVGLRSEVLEPLQHERLFLAGDAASSISPSAAKGANLAIVEAEILAKGLVAAVRSGEEKLLREYSATCLPRIWRAQEFSQWMIRLLHGPAGDDDEAVFERALQGAQLANLRDSRAHQDFFATNYVGI